ncbi:retrovirus-related pol polyprotein from transposon TNT 1-94 [Tanacetum coccineum]
MTFDETPPPSKTSPLVNDDLNEEEAIKVTEKKNLENDIEDETLEINELVNIKESRNHPLENVIGNLNQRTLRSQAQNQSNFFCFISTIEPKNVNEALTDDSWIVAMQEELNQFIANNARLVAQGYNQQKGIDYDETYALVARLESIRILLAYACALDFKLFQMDVKTAFQNGFINEEVYVAQPLGFIDFEKSDHVYKLKKALYGLKQAPKAWYDRLKAFLIKHEYKMRMVDNTLFTKKKSSNLIIVQIYVDDIIFGLTCQDMCDEFAKIVHDKFEISMMGELNFFLGLQIKQMEDGIFINQSKYIKEMLKKFGLEESKPMKTPMSSDTKLTKDEECESIDSTKYRGMIVIIEYLVNISKRHAFWSLNEDILKINDSDNQYAVSIKEDTARHFKTLSLDELRLPDFNLSSDKEYSEEEVVETMTETMEQYMSKTRADYGLGVSRPKIEDNDNFELKGQFFKELQTNTFSGSDHEDANEHIEKVLEIVDLFHIPNITIDQVMLRAFHMSLTGAASHWLRNEPTSSITTWNGLKTKFLNKYFPPARTAKKMEEINNFQQEPDENLYQTWERFKKLLMKFPQHYLTEMQEVILFYNGLRIPTRQILDSRGAIPSKTVDDAKVAIQEMAEYSKKWHNGTSRSRSTETSDELAAIQAQLNNLGRKIKKVNEKVYAAQVGCEQCKGPHYTKDFPLKEEGKTLEEAYYTQFGGPFQ